MARGRASLSSRWGGLWATLQRPLVVLAGIGTLLGGIAGYVNLYRTVSHEPPAAPPSAAAPLANPISILVLPFANQTGDPAKGYVADGLTTAITGDLTRIADALVVPPLTAVGLQEKHLSLAQLGAEARVRFVLQGGVSTSGEKVRISAQLSDTASGGQLWSRTFEGSLTDLFALQDEVTTQVRAAVGPQMVVAAARDIDTHKSSGRAADLLLRARALLLQDQSAQNLKTVQSLCHAALLLEPENAAAMSCQARSLWLQQANFSQSLGLDASAGAALLLQAEELARKALRAAPGDATLYYVLSDAALARGEYESARQMLMHALEIDPRLAPTYNNLGALELMLGQGEPAHAHFLQAARIPSYLPQVRYYGNLCLSAFMLGRADDALAWARKAVELEPESADYQSCLAMAHALGGDAPRARQAAAETLRLEPKFRLRWAEQLPWPGREDAWRSYLETRVRPAARLAGLPE